MIGDVKFYVSPDDMQVYSVDHDDGFSLRYSDTFDFISFCKDHCNLEFTEFKELVERKFHKEKDFAYFDKYCVEGV